jgi:hypothetical protein
MIFKLAEGRIVMQQALLFYDTYNKQNANNPFETENNA